jgi:hypothetical protein
LKQTGTKLHVIVGTGCPVAWHVKLWDFPATLTNVAEDDMIFGVSTINNIVINYRVF